MKNRKASKQQIAEDRNALYHKAICHNLELAKSNSELSKRINYLETDLAKATEKIFYLTRRRWWQFWKLFKTRKHVN